MLQLSHFPANSAWAFVFGHDPRTASPLQLTGEPLFFPDRAAAVDAARRKGLTATSRGAVQVAATFATGDDGAIPKV